MNSDQRNQIALEFYMNSAGVCSSNKIQTGKFDEYQRNWCVLALFHFDAPILSLTVDQRASECFMCSSHNSDRISTYKSSLHRLSSLWSKRYFSVLYSLYSWNITYCPEAAVTLVPVWKWGVSKQGILKSLVSNVLNFESWHSMLSGI